MSRPAARPGRPCTLERMSRSLELAGESRLAVSPQQLLSKQAFSDLLGSVIDRHGTSVKSVLVGLSFTEQFCSGTPLQRFHSWLQRARNNKPLSRSAPAVDGGAPRFLPTHLPASPVVGALPPSGRARTRNLVSRCAWEVTEWIVSVCSFYELGCPHCVNDYQNRLGCYYVSEHQEAAVSLLFKEVRAFFEVRPSSDWIRGRKSLLDAIRELAASDVSFGAVADLHLQPPLAIDPDRIALPAAAGKCESCKYLSPERQEVYSDLSKIVKSEDEWTHPLPRPCHMISPENEKVFRRRLVECDMAELILENDVPVDRFGRKLLAGMFAVEHKIESDRLIIDRRPQNSTEHRLHWAHLPHGTMLCQLRLPPPTCISALPGSMFPIIFIIYPIQNVGGNALPLAVFSRGSRPPNWEGTGPRGTIWP